MIINRVLVALDGSDHAAKALDLACEVASRFGAELIAMHAMPDKPLSEAERRMAEVEFQPEVARHFDVTPFMDARGDIRLMSQRLTEQAAETGRRFRLALGERLVEDAKARAQQRAVASVRTLLRERVTRRRRSWISPNKSRPTSSCWGGVVSATWPGSCSGACSTRWLISPSAHV